MSNYSKYNIIYRLQKWMDSVPGQTFLNYGYSWGASVVIAGALFKLTHLPGANIMLFFGMGTEIIVFFLSAFDRPFDKTDDGRELPTRVVFDEEGAASEEYDDDDEVESEVEATQEEQESASAHGSSAGGQANPVAAGGYGGYAGPVGGGAYQSSPSPAQQATGAAVEAAHAAVGAQTAAAAMPTAEQVAMAMLNYQRGDVEGAQQQAPEMVEAQTKYVDALKNLTEMLGKVNEQSERLTRDSEEMENLNRTLTGIAKIYEMQLKGASQQVGTIDQINEQTRKMAQQIADLNAIYARMIEAMTVNMRVAAPGAAAPSSGTTTPNAGV